MQSQLFFTLFLIALLFPYSTLKAKNELLIILAHPDDETLIAQYLIELDRSKWEPTIIYLTAGEGGTDRRWEKNQAVLNKRKKLQKTRILELTRSMKILDIQKYFVLNVPDLPHRIPTPGYSNPLGKPTTNLELFFKKVEVWKPENVISLLKKIIHKHKLHSTTHVLTMCDCSGITHAHHQATNYLVKKLIQHKVFKNLQQAWQFGEGKSYPKEMYFMKRSQVLFRRRAKEMTSKDFFKYLQVYQAHQSQGVSSYTREKLLSFSEKIWEL
ncbi:PIG-L family deacetylase [Bacteriovoracaceae bacterium]|nr:PIG-L family deacetylase [Bacteriovoracaceae bacterium]